MYKITKRKNTIKVYAQHFPQPITNIKDFNKLLKEEGFNYKTNRKELAKILGYT